jgi:hypothetical protein
MFGYLQHIVACDRKAVTHWPKNVENAVRNRQKQKKADSLETNLP